MAQEGLRPQLRQYGERIGNELRGSNVPLDIEDIALNQWRLNPGQMRRFNEALGVLKQLGTIRDVGNNRVEWVWNARPESTRRPPEQFVFLTQEEVQRAQVTLNGNRYCVNPANAHVEGSLRYRIMMQGEVDGLTLYEFDPNPV